MWDTEICIYGKGCKMYAAGPLNKLKRTNGWDMACFQNTWTHRLAAGFTVLLFLITLLSLLRVLGPV